MKTLEFKSDQILNSLMDCSELGIVVFDRNALCKKWNTYMKNFFGKEEDDVLGKNLLEILPLNVEDIKTGIDWVLQGEPVALKYLVPGEEAKGYVRFELIPLFEEQNKIAGGVCMIKKTPQIDSSVSIAENSRNHPSKFDKEVTLKDLISPADIAYTLKKTLSQLNESEKIADMGSWDWETQNEWMTWSENLFKIFGYTNYPRIISGVDFFSHLLPEDRQVVGEAVKTLAEEMKPFDIEHKIIRKDGEIIWIYCRGRTIESKDGKSLRMIGVAQDITKRKTLEAILKKTNDELEERVKSRTRELFLSEERFRLVSQATKDAIWDWDVKNNKLWWNESFKELFGVPEKGSDPGFEAWARKIHPEDRDSVMNNVKNIIKYSIPFGTSEYRYLKRDGTYAYVLDRCYTLYDEQGQAYRMVGSMVDLSPMKEIQQELKKSNEVLRRINTDLDNFIYTASHDLKAPISNLEGLILAVKDYSMETDAKEMIGMMETSVERLKRTILDLTEITKVQKESPVTEKVRIEEVYKEVINSFQEEIDRKKVNLFFHIDTDEEILFSRKNLKSLFLNLISNAVKYSSPLRDPEIKIYAEKNDTHFVIHIEDNGLGLNDNQITKIFSMFKRAHTHVEGSGIGLYVVKRIMENFGGRVSVTSTEGKGSCFSLYFPKENNFEEAHI